MFIATSAIKIPYKIVFTDPKTNPISVFRPLACELPESEKRPRLDPRLDKLWEN